VVEDLLRELFCEDNEVMAVAKPVPHAQGVLIEFPGTHRPK
jgi:hypothetical protein